MPQIIKAFLQARGSSGNLLRRKRGIETAGVGDGLDQQYFLALRVERTTAIELHIVGDPVGYIDDIQTQQSDPDGGNREYAQGE